MKTEIIKKLYELITHYNSITNITTITTYEDFLIKHIKDSELGEEYIKGNKILDIGSGGGFPGLVIAINNPNSYITLIDSVGKKVDIINNIINQLDIKNATAIKSRIEDFNQLNTFTTVTARAVAPLNTLVEYALPFLKIGGILIAYKSNEITEELNGAKTAIKMLGGKLLPLQIKQLTPEINRTLVLIEKIKPTPLGYPRKQNKPKLNPLK